MININGYSIMSMNTDPETDGILGDVGIIKTLAAKPSQLS